MAVDLQDLADPVELLVFVASGCAHCPQAVRVANGLAQENQLITTTIVDAQSNLDLARKYAVRSVPVTILNGDLTIIGVISRDELAQRILSQVGEGYDRQVFLSLVESGRFAEAAKKIREHQAGDHFLFAWRKSTTFERVALMLVAEEVREEDPSAMDGLVAGLVGVLAAPHGALRGDTADLLGQIGNVAAAPALQELLNDPNPDVAEAAAEALEELGLATWG